MYVHVYLGELIQRKVGVGHCLYPKVGYSLAPPTGFKGFLVMALLRKKVFQTGHLIFNCFQECKNPSLALTP